MKSSFLEMIVTELYSALNSSMGALKILYIITNIIIIIIIIIISCQFPYFTLQ